MSGTVSRVLWTMNIVLPDVSAALGVERQHFGGWLGEMTRRLADRDDLKLGVAMRAPVAEVRKIEQGALTYYAVPQARRNPHDMAQSDVEGVLKDFAPDLLHVEGTEMPYAHRFLSTWQGPNVVSVQGIINGYAPHQMGRLPIARMLSDVRRPRNALVAAALKANEWFRFRPRLAAERATLALADHAVGRTLWDRAWVAALNPDATYHHCARILRDDFGDDLWSPRSMQRNTLFVGNSATPLKGAHVVAEAVALLARDFPDIRVVVAGQDPGDVPRRSLKGQVGYQVYLKQRLRDLGVAERFEFTGILPARDMAERMRRCHAFLLPSLIENSPNTLGEAMIMAMPCVASYAGGVPSMARDEDQALLFRAGDPAMMAMQIRRVLEDDAFAETLGQAARQQALKTHDAQQNVEAMAAIYRGILGQGQTDPQEAAQ